jgi:hypothetical protein
MKDPVTAFEVTNWHLKLEIIICDLAESAIGSMVAKCDLDRFPEDFMFQLREEEFKDLRFQIGMSKTSGRGGRRYLPYAFTEQGVAMLSSVLHSKRAVRVNIEIMRAFVRLREMIASNKELAKRLAQLEKKYDAQFKVVFDAIRELMTPPKTPVRRIGFQREGVK